MIEVQQEFDVLDVMLRSHVTRVQERAKHECIISP